MKLFFNCFVATSSLCQIIVPFCKSAELYLTLFETHMQYPEGHVSDSMYAIFRLISSPNSCNSLEEFFPNLSLAIWTTTPWTIPANAGESFLIVII